MAFYTRKGFQTIATYSCTSCKEAACLSKTAQERSFRSCLALAVSTGASSNSDLLGEAACLLEASDCQFSAKTKRTVLSKRPSSSLSLVTRPSDALTQFLIKCVGASRSYSITSLSHYALLDYPYPTDRVKFVKDIYKYTIED